MNDAVFLDTVGLLALWNRRDQWHAAAKSAFAALVKSRRRLITTSLIMLECGNAAARQPFRESLLALRKELLAGGDLLEPTPEDLEKAWTAYGLSEAAQAGIVDHVSFCIMRREGLTDAFSNDHHLRAAGFVTLF